MDTVTEVSMHIHIVKVQQPNKVTEHCSVTTPSLSHATSIYLGLLRLSTSMLQTAISQDFLDGWMHVKLDCGDQQPFVSFYSCMHPNDIACL